MLSSVNWHNASAWTEQRLQEALTEAPHLVLSVYSYGILLRKQTALGVTEHAVSAEQVVQALAGKVRLDTGLMAEDVLLVRREGVRQVILSYRPAQKTGIWLEGLADAVRVYLPPLVLCASGQGQTMRYSLFAVKARPKAESAPLFQAPLPNVYNEGGICWGNLSLPEPQATDLQAVWRALLASAFGTHAVTGKSQRYPQDIRQHLLSLAQTPKRRYPLADLVPSKRTLGQVLAKAMGDA